MKKPKTTPKPLDNSGGVHTEGGALSAEEKLAIRDEVERRVLDLPSSTWEKIQTSVGSKIAARDKVYIGAAVFVLSVAGYFGLDLKNTYKELKTQSVALNESVKNSLEGYALMTNRVRELSEMDNVITRSRLQQELKIIEQLREETQQALFSAILVSAQQGDAVAYDRMRDWSTNSAHPLSIPAQKALADILRSINGPFNKPIDSWIVPDTAVKTTWDLTLGLDNAQSVYSGSLPEERVSVIEAIATATNFTQVDRIHFLVNASLRDTTLTGRRRAVELLNEQLGDKAPMKFDVRSPDQISSWWHTNRSK